MKKVILSVVALAALGMLTSCSCHGLRVNYSKTEALAEESRSLTGFERIELLGSLDVKYTQADSFSVLVKAPVEVIKDVQIGVTNSDDVTVYVSSPDFIGIELKGSGDFDCVNLLDTDNLDISLKGSGDIQFDDIICDQVNVSLVGSGDVELKNVKTLRSTVELVGSGDVKVHFDDSGAVESHLTGSGDITLTGSIQNYKSNVRGSGDMHTDDLRVNKERTVINVK